LKPGTLSTARRTATLTPINLRNRQQKFPKIRQKLRTINVCTCSIAARYQTTPQGYRLHGAATAAMDEGP